MSDLAQQLNLRPEHFRSEDGTTALLVYLAGMVGIFMVNMDEKKKANPYLRFHMTQSIGLIVVMLVLSLLTCGFFSIIYIPLAAFYGFKAMKGEVFEIPVITSFMLNKGYFDSVKELTSAGTPPAFPT